MKRVLTDGKIKKVKKSENGIVKVGDHWVNRGVTIVKSIPCVIPLFMEELMATINRKFSNVEFSIFAKSYYDEERKKIFLTEEYYIPKQEVTFAGVDYNEGPPEGFNTVIHKHPSGISHFSSTDDTYINQNHDYSLLWTGGRFVSGQVRFRSMFGMSKLPVTIEKEWVDIEVSGLDNISIRKVHKSTTKKDSAVWSCEDYVDYRYKGPNMHKSPYLGPHGGSPIWEPKADKIGGDKPVSGPTNDYLTREGFLNPELEQIQSELSEDLLDEYTEEVEEIMLERGVGWEKAVEIHSERGLCIDDIEGTFGL